MHPIGSRLSHYRIEALLGAGGMGQVYRAFDEKLHRRVALKVLLAPDALAAQSMVREARAAAAVEHPNKVSIFELGEVDGVPFLAMELINGPTLRKWVGDRSIAWQEVVTWLLDIARALEGAHAVGLVHRDIKPDNVMLRDDGVVKVLDFGIARRSAAVVDPLGSTGASGLPTATGGVIVGTVAYMAPEQVRGDALDGRCDQFAWAVMAFELLTGEHPWGSANDPLALLSTMLTRPPRMLADARPELPAKLSAIVARALSANRDERFPSMRDVVAELTPIVGPSARALLHPPRASAAEELAIARTEAVSPPMTNPNSGVTVREVPAEGRAATIGIALVAIALVAAGGWALLHRNRALSRTEPEVAPAASSTPRAAVFPCNKTQRELPPVSKERACSGDAVAWCSETGRIAACCTKGLVPVGGDGMCGCPKVMPSDPAKRHPSCASGPVEDDSPQYFRGVVRSRYPEIQACYERVLAESPGTKGSIAVWFEIDPEGVVYFARIKETSFSQPEAQRCMLDIFRSLRFGPRSEEVTVTYPIQFTPGE